MKTRSIITALIIVIGLLVGAAVYPVPKPKAAAQEHQKVSDKGPPKAAVLPVPATPCQPAANVKKDCPKEKAEEIWQKAFSPESWPSWAVVIAGLGAILVGLRTLRIIERQTKATEVAANAALLNAQAVINSDRPWVVIFAVKEFKGFSFRAGNLGKTPAEIISFAAEFRCVENVNELPAIAEYGTETIPVIRLLVPGRKPGQADLELLPSSKFADLVRGCTRTTDRTEYALMPGRKLPIFCFRIKYANPLSRARPDISQHETRMCFYYSPILPDQLAVCGSEEYNRHT
jgi:hypothetical protein